MQKVEKTIAGKEMRLETGRIARQSNGAVLVSLGETTVLATVNAAKEPREEIDFFPLQVEYREKHYAGGKIPGGFFKREARPAEHEILTSRLTDRPLRPLFPKGFKNETQVMITVLQSDGENMADVLAGVGASAALMCSTIPWNGPIASVRIGRVDGTHIVNPTRSEMEDSDLELIVSGNEETVVMVEGEATCMSESDMILALKEAHSKIKEIIQLQNELVSSLNVVKDEFSIPEPDPELIDAINNLVENKVSDIVKAKDKKDWYSCIFKASETNILDQDELDAAIEASLTNGVNYADLIFLTGHDTYMNLQQLLTKGGDGGAATILRYDQAQGGAASQNGVLGQAGLNYDSRVGSYNGIPIFVSQHVAKDVTARIHLLDLPQLALRVAAPTTYVANDNLAITQSLTKQFALISAMELINYRFNTHASIRDLAT